MELCNNCGEEIKQFTLSNATIAVTGGQKIKIVRLGCPVCHHIQYTLANESQITELGKRVKALEDIVMKTGNG